MLGFFTFCWNFLETRCNSWIVQLNLIALSIQQTNYCWILLDSPGFILVGIFTFCCNLQDPTILLDLVELSSKQTVFLLYYVTFSRLLILCCWEFVGIIKIVGAFVGCKLLVRDDNKTNFVCLFDTQAKKRRQKITDKQANLFYKMKNATSKMFQKHQGQMKM